MDDNAAVYDQVADLVESDPAGELEGDIDDDREQ
jgi:hypothetical protein